MSDKSQDGDIFDDEDYLEADGRDNRLLNQNFMNDISLSLNN